MRFLIVSQDDLFRRRLVEALRERSIAADEVSPDALSSAPRADRIVVDVTRAATPGGVMLAHALGAIEAFPEASVVVMAPFPSASLMHRAMRLGARHCIPRTDSAAAILAAFDECERPVELSPRVDASFASLDEARWQHIGRALDASRGNISGAARLLGIHRQSLQRILRSLRSGTGVDQDQPAEEPAEGRAKAS